MDVSTILTVGHSTHDLESFVPLLRLHEVKTIVDVRSSPASKFAPDFHRQVLAKRLPDYGVKYVFLGEQLGGRPREAAHYDEDGRALYSEMAQTPTFQEGIDLIERNQDRTRIALMCSEGKPHECHRHLLIERVLRNRGISVRHILPDGSLIELPVPELDHPQLFPEGDEWKSARSVLRSGQQRAFSKP